MTTKLQPEVRGRQETWSAEQALAVVSSSTAMRLSLGLAILGQSLSRPDTAVLLSMFRFNLTVLVAELKRVDACAKLSAAGSLPVLVSCLRGVRAFGMGFDLVRC